MPVDLTPLAHGPLYDAIDNEDYASAHDFMQRHYIAPFLYGNPMRTIPIFAGISPAQWEAVRSAGATGRGAAGRGEIDASPALPKRPNRLRGRLLRPDGEAEQPMVTYGRIFPGAGPESGSPGADFATSGDAATYRTTINIQFEGGRLVGQPGLSYSRFRGRPRSAAPARRQAFSGQDAMDLPACTARQAIMSGRPTGGASRINKADLTDGTGLRQINKDQIASIGELDEFILIL